ncbi:MAG: hypothetical protein LBK77_09330 [Spirochaetaceae bacterium]|jgi:hypothetical protein|nr:hypothetical protein [Spirochaetaceae bacterium]
MAHVAVRRIGLFCGRVVPILLILLSPALFAQEVLRGEVCIELEQIRGFDAEETYSMDPAEARKKGLEEAARYYGAMIYGWSFRYEVGEKARQIEEVLELSPLGTVAPGDPALEVTGVQVKDFKLYLWSDYRTGGAQQYRLARWKTGLVRSAQGYGKSSLDDKYAALEDAARAALRSILQGGERNRPREASGYISLAAFPRYWLDKGRWMAAGRFRVEMGEITPFAAY